MKANGTLSDKLNIAVLVTGVGVSSIGDFIYQIAINVLVLRETQSPSAVAGLWVISRIAALVVGPWIGSIADRFPRRTQLIILEFCRGTLIGLIPLFTNIAYIYGILFFLGVCTTYFGSLFLPYQTMLVPEKSRKRTNAILSTLRYSAFLTGSAIAGVLMVNGNVALPLWLDSGSFIVSAASFLLLPNLLNSAGEKPDKKANPWRTVLADWRIALKFLFGNRLFCVIFSLNAAVGIFALTADAQEVVFAQQALHLGQLGYGMMVTAAGVGFTCGSLLLSVVTNYVPLQWLLAVGIVLNGLGYLVYALSHSFIWAVVGLVILGIFGSAASVGYTTYTQRVMPVSYMGRINSVIGPPQEVFNIVFVLAGGVVASVFGVRSLMVTMTLLMSAAAIGMAFVVLRSRATGVLANSLHVSEDVSFN